MIRRDPPGILNIRIGQTDTDRNMKAASWAVSFYEKYGFIQVTEEEKNILLNKYWKIPERQIETSVVLADKNYIKKYKK